MDSSTPSLPPGTPPSQAACSRRTPTGTPSGSQSSPPPPSVSACLRAQQQALVRACQASAEAEAGHRRAAAVRAGVHRRRPALPAAAARRRATAPAGYGYQSPDPDCSLVNLGIMAQVRSLIELPTFYLPGLLADFCAATVAAAARAAAPGRCPRTQSPRSAQHLQTAGCTPCMAPPRLRLKDHRARLARLLRRC